MKNQIADSVVTCNHCETEFTLRSLGQTTCPRCDRDIEDPVLAKVVEVPAVVENLCGAFMEVHDNIIFGAEPDKAIKRFRRVVAKAERYLREKASKPITA